MSGNICRRKALVLSPIASWPLDYGNRNRVYRTTCYLRDQGYEIHFILYPFEPDWLYGIPDSVSELRSAWTSFTLIAPSRPLHSASVGEHHQIDEWWDPQIATHLNWLFARAHFDVFLVNYTFLSKAFEFAPRTTTKLLEIHDIFAGRKEMFARYGAPPEFFYTTWEQERIALNRADIVLAIKDTEADDLRRMTRREVISVPFYAEGVTAIPPRPERLNPEEPLRVGFIGAKNSVNIINMRQFLAIYERFELLYIPNLRIDVAGNVCSDLRTESPNVDLLGRVSSLEEFYRNVDVVIAPLEFSTGIKIKVGEALAYEKPVIATANGFDGFPPLDEFHAVDNIEGVCRALVKVAFDRDRLLHLENASRMSRELASHRCSNGYSALKRAIDRRATLTIVVTDQQVWHNETVQQERLAQWSELCSYLTRTVIVYVGPPATNPPSRGYPHFEGSVDIVHCEERVDLALDAIAQLAKSFNVIETIVSVTGHLTQQFWNGLSGLVRYVTLDMWSLDLANLAGVDFPAARVSDMWLLDTAAASDSEHGQHLSAPPFRYLPDRLSGWKTRRATSEVVVVDCEANEFDRMGIELLESLVGEDLPVYLIESEATLDLLSEMGVHRIPGRILAVGESPEILGVCRCLARLSGAEFIQIASPHLPQVVVDANGAPRLCTTFTDVADYITDSPYTGPHQHASASDVGWSTYWKILERRLPQTSVR